MRRIRVTLGYDGTDFAGWQRQDNGISVQGVLEEVIESLFGEKVSVQGSGRTDAGVHALGQVAAFDLEHPIPVSKLLLALNSNLPESIRVFEVTEADPSFHPQFQAKKKTYAYLFYAGKVLPPHLRRHCILVKEALCFPLMERALSDLKGEHDFAAFCGAGSTVTSTVRTVYDARIKPFGDFPGLYALLITGNGFLYHMVRIITGTVLEIGRGNLPIEALHEALSGGKRDPLAPTAPANGLTLLQVEYPEEEESQGM